MPVVAKTLAPRRVAPDPGVVAFLGAATIPRLRASSPLRLLPVECVQLVARFARPAPYRAGFALATAVIGAGPMDVLISGEEVQRLSGLSIDQLEATAVDVTDRADAVLRLARLITRSTYVEILLSKAWHRRAAWKPNQALGATAARRQDTAAKRRRRLDAPRRKRCSA